MAVPDLNEPSEPPNRPGEDQPAAASEMDARRLGQQLHLQQIELEMQFEELQRAQDELKAPQALVDQQVLARTALLSQTIEDLSKEVRVRRQSQLSLLGACTELELMCDRLRAENATLNRQLGRP
jgi:hypothetical protein